MSSIPLKLGTFTKKKKAYTCSTSWFWEVGYTDVRIYDSVNRLKMAESCAEECGIVELEISLVREVSQPVPKEFESYPPCGCPVRSGATYRLADTEENAIVGGEIVYECLECGATWT